MRMMRTSSCLPAAVCLAALLAAPLEHRAGAFSPDAVECLDGAKDAAARQECAEAEVKLQAKALAEAIQRVKKSSDGRAADLLMRSQQAWEAHRDAHCAWMADRLRKDPQAQRIEHQLCLAGATETRWQELEDYQNVP